MTTTPRWQAHSASNYDRVMGARCGELLTKIVADADRRQAILADPRDLHRKLFAPFAPSTHTDYAGTYRGTPGTALADRRMYAARQIDLGTEYEFCLPGEVPPRMVELLKNTHALLGEGSADDYGRLGVRYVLGGAVRKASGKVRITGQLIDAVTGAHLWADRFERDLTDIFALQDEVTLAVVSAVQPKMLQTEIEMATRRRPENLTAYDFFLRSMQQHYLTTRESLAEAIRLAHRALELDPRFGSAAALAGDCHASNVALGYANDPKFDCKEAVRLARLALRIDDGDPDTLSRVAVILAGMVGASEAEIEMADRAVALNPNSWRTWNNRGWVYIMAGLPEEAIRSFERAIRMSPVDPLLHMTFLGIGHALMGLRRFDEAIVVLKKALSQNPFFMPACRGLASALAHLGRDAEAHAAAARVLEIDPAFTISAHIARVPKNSKLFIEGLRKAGLPE
ncbi:tetratricopeptide repeat protein [Bradyrhizobium sp. CCBAU 051011]|uniref:tetratricopeptide repeat protein n=1 Tax=Bradyrhizobium sp. CCBAU 051011 TaxID=858422 RepID=UPI001FEDC18C|nr:tetratricopeptide repeat protein [Bradyrhizobium sp. CCBAU 051011]